VAVAKIIFPYFPQYYYYAVCGANSDLSNCPVTERLKTRLMQAHLTLCRCQNPALSFDVTAAPTQTGGVAHVILGDQFPVKMDLIIVQTDGKLLVDDEICTGGGSSTSIYVTDAPC
jgi:hypothetical protein